MTKPLRTGDIIRLVNPGYGEPTERCVVLADQQGALVWFMARSGGAAFVARRSAVHLIKRVPPNRKAPMISLMLSGRIAKAPATCTTAKGTPYTMVTLKVQTADGDLFPTVFAFDPLAGTLAELAKSDAVTVVGTGKIGTYEPKDGSGTRASLSITANRIVALVDHQAAPRPKSNGPRHRRPSGATAIGLFRS